MNLTGARDPLDGDKHLYYLTVLTSETKKEHILWLINELILTDASFCLNCI